MIKSISYLCMMTGLILIAWIDGRKKMIPNKWLLMLLGTKVMLTIAECMLCKGNWRSVCSDSIKGFVIGGGILLLCYWMTAGRLGAGDVKLFAVLGLYLGSKKIYYAMFFSVLSFLIIFIFVLLLYCIWYNFIIFCPPFARQ